MCIREEFYQQLMMFIVVNLHCIHDNHFISQRFFLFIPIFPLSVTMVMKTNDAC